MRALITGASSGIGRELAAELARRGHDVALLARREDLLREAAAAITNHGRRAVVIACDVLDAGSVADALRRAEAELGGPLDLAVANAGVSIPNHAANFVLADAEQVFRVNVLGLMNLYAAVIPGMVERRSGHFVGVASLAGLRGIPAAAPYSASKAAVQTFLEASRIELAPLGVAVTIVNPGFVSTAMTEKNRFRMPLLMNVDRAAKIIADGIESRKRVVEFPRRMSMMVRFLRSLPDPLYDRSMMRYGRRSMDRDKVKR